MAAHPVARAHPETGKTVFFVNRVFNRRFVEQHGMDAAMIQSLIQELFAKIG